MADLEGGRRSRAAASSVCRACREVEEMSPRGGGEGLRGFGRGVGRDIGVVCLCVCVLSGGKSGVVMSVVMVGMGGNCRWSAFG